jgi:hypothetical protein
MSHKGLKFWIALVLSLAASLVSWYVFLTDNGREGNIFFLVWYLVNIIPSFMSVLGGHAGNIGMFVVGTALQWFVIGWFVGVLVGHIRKKSISY